MKLSASPYCTLLYVDTMETAEIRCANGFTSPSSFLYYSWSNNQWPNSYCIMFFQSVNLKTSTEPSKRLFNGQAFSWVTPTQKSLSTVLNKENEIFMPGVCRLLLFLTQKSDILRVLISRSKIRFLDTLRVTLLQPWTWDLLVYPATYGLWSHYK